MSGDPLAFRLDCGAPWLNLLATRGRHFGPDPVERIATEDRLAQWLEQVELTPLAPVTAHDLVRAHRLREILRPLALAVTDGEEPPSEAAGALQEFVADAGPVRLTWDDDLRRTAPETVADALGRIAVQAADHLTGASRHDLRVCPERDCRGVFTDAGGRRRWCPSPACASRGRVRALRERRRKETS